MKEQTEISLAARAHVDRQGFLRSADEPLALLHEDCGGLIPGPFAVPELRALALHCMELGLRLGREFSAFNGNCVVTGFARIHPHEDGSGCEILVENWQRHPPETLSSRDLASRLDEIDRASAEISARLDEAQRLQYILADNEDAVGLLEAVEARPGCHWTDYLKLRGVAHQQPLHWRLLDGSQCELPGSDRVWRIRLLPLGSRSNEPRGFDLLLLAETAMDRSSELSKAPHSQLVGSALTPVLRRPIARIIANAETMRARLAGPLRAEYSEYAGNISLAAQHLGAMLDDLADIETLDSPDFKTAKEEVDLVDVARRAAGILGVRARSKGIDLSVSDCAEPVVADADFRRVLQIIINLVTNAIAYSPDGSTVTVSFKTTREGLVEVQVADEGQGVRPDQADRIFDKFERLGRENEASQEPGSGLGLYISRRLAREMGGDLTVAPSSSGVDSPGATFTLSLPMRTK